MSPPFSGSKNEPSNEESSAKHVAMSPSACVQITLLHFHRTCGCGGNALVFGRCSVRASTRTCTILRFRAVFLVSLIVCLMVCRLASYLPLPLRFFPVYFHQSSYHFVLCNVIYRLSTMNRPVFGDVLKISRFFFQMLKVSCLLQEFKFLPKY
jgi:hypothetical protein